MNVLKDPVKRQAEFATLLDGMVQYELSDKKSNQAFFDDVIRKALANGLKVNLPGVAASAAAEPPAPAAPAAR